MLYFGLNEWLMTVRVLYMSLASQIATGPNVIQILWNRKQVAEIHN